MKMTQVYAKIVNKKKDEAVKKKYLEISLKICENPQYYAYSNHLLYIGETKK